MSPTSSSWTALSLTGATPGRRIDVTWRIVDTVARPGLFLLGDAARVMDPALSHGVITAIRSGIMAVAFLTTRDAAVSAQLYNEWTWEEFLRDVAALDRAYEAFPAWRGLIPLPSLR